MKTLNAQKMIFTLECLKSGTRGKRFKKEVECLFENIIQLLKRGENIEKGLIKFLENENPYPENIFLPIEKEDFNKINNLLKNEMGYSIDRLMGNMGRKLYKSIIEILKEVIK